MRMAVQGSGSATPVVIMTVLWLVLLESAAAQARVYAVGDGKGWTFNVTNWTNGKKFRVGDILEFDYPAEAHNVVALTSRVAYNWCMKTRSSKVYQTGKDQIKLNKKGKYFFICSFPDHCQAGMKIALTASNN